ncbi:MAG TPA: glycosyltransferase family A protein [Planctomycetaceae bacterium]|jgi:hypothetical protein|nr:glycosyltransferase family A protein [Planctomycetaceae bacterium]
MTRLQSIREWLGVAVRDWRRYRRAFHADWTTLCNRIERLTPNPAGPGVQCEWNHGSDLHGCRVWPNLGRDLMRVALQQWPISFANAAVPTTGPRVSFIIAHGGRARLPQLCRTVRSLFAQTGIQLECVIVDQTDEPVSGDLPTGIVYHHLAKTGVDRGWHKSWAYNVGARIASGDILVFHDGDICVPVRYGAELVRALSQGDWDVASIQRFLFYLNERDTARVDCDDAIDGRLVPDRVCQNWKGGTIAIRRDAFFSIGGFDEGFVDWGGEDDEFFDRCRQTLRHCRFGFLPFVHLWHAPQVGRKAIDNPNIAHVLPSRMSLPAEDRVQELTQRDFGNPQGPDPARAYKMTLHSQLPDPVPSVPV